MAIDYGSIFGNNYFTRAQVDILVRLSELIIADAGGGGMASDPTKADKIIEFIAGAGLTGGGDLSQNRTFYVDFNLLDGYYPRLVNGKIPLAFIPPIPGYVTYQAASEAAMLALSANQGDHCIRTDTGTEYVLSQIPASTLSNWIALPSASGVSSFNARTGAITPAQNDYTFAQIASKPTTLAGYGITDAEPAITAGTSGQYWRYDKAWATLDKVAVGLGNVDNTSDNAKPLGTTQLGTLAADTGMGLLGGKGPGTGSITRTLDAQFYERGLSLRNYANADGTDETSKVQNWLNACALNKRKGYAPAGEYKISTVSLIGDQIEVECHPEAKFTGIVTETQGSELAPSVTGGTYTLTGSITPPTQDGTGIHFNAASNVSAAFVTVTALKSNTTYDVSVTLANYVSGGVRLIIYGDTNANFVATSNFTTNGVNTVRVTTTDQTGGSYSDQLRLQAIGPEGTNTFDVTALSVKEVFGTAADPMFTITSQTGTTSARVGSVRWKGGRINVADRGYTTTGTGTGMKIVNFGAVSVEDVEFIGQADHEAAIVAGKSGSGLRISVCDAVCVKSNLFRGFAETGVYLEGGPLTATSDDPVGANIGGNHFHKCQYGWQARAMARNVLIASNEYDGCYIGGAALESGAVRAARVNVKGDVYRRSGLHALHLRHQVGFVVSDCTILDTGYKLDGATTVAGSTAVFTEGCAGGQIQGNVIRMDELAKFTGTFGIKNIHHVHSSVTIQPTDLSVNGNHIHGVDTGLSEVGAAGANNRYRDNDFSNVTTEHANIPAAFLPYGSYAPVLTGVNNVAAVSANTSMWRREGSMVIVNLHLTIDPTATGAGEVEVSLPIDPGADFTADQDLLGVANSGTAGFSGHMVAKTTAGSANRVARLLFVVGTDVGNRSWSGVMSYRLGVAASAPPPPPPPGAEDTLTTAAGDPITTAAGDTLTVSV